ncbi:hypothetical protein RND71_021787 [Anisodus tanguticus]|uniref:Uncharacterized protein n=1 Tax=Anisodus tanguticus TaxID=243964 RepID=A0AAE1V7L9_9SOLA|nr:hypothetical protein RND71_021787 [Anisodus tanguticus]
MYVCLVVVDSIPVFPNYGVLGKIAPGSIRPKNVWVKRHSEASSVSNKLCGSGGLNGSSQLSSTLNNSHHINHPRAAHRSARGRGNVRMLTSSRATIV